MITGWSTPKEDLSYLQALRGSARTRPQGAGRDNYVTAMNQILSKYGSAQNFAAAAAPQSIKAGQNIAQDASEMLRTGMAPPVPPPIIDGKVVQVPAPT